ncbi:DNA polymerase IV 1 [Weizmannia acidilactici]|mgnify:CR=1 FL=1|uniref:DNA polymerase IV n=2 Tax=Weizmannia acidilactici TaxID=2607726 RepID=A0A5J4J2R4_9BACI|nr:DNA polymerase IV 1 [Weizmannia acidilactici]GER69256.1 DNA polymerase IV 1 [Weizmannia acidilactici]GER72417.1 DNA polymerase IV 1 [Weizmannia acidilactici]
MMKQFYLKNGRVILHVDMNSFFASVEMAENPGLKGKPVAIAGNPKERKGIIVTCSYEARKYGVKTTMPVWEAKKRCPDLLVIPPHFERYKKASAAMFAILRRYSPLVEPVSIDEGYVDITDQFEPGSPLLIAESIQQEILAELDLPSSIGVAPNKFLAKTASDMKKPLGITVLRKRDIPRLLWPMPLIDMHGVGGKTAEKLEKHGIFTIGDLAHADDVLLKQLLGIRGIRLKERANGKDNRPVDPESVNVTKSIGRMQTLPEDLDDEHRINAVLKKLADETAERMEKKGYAATNVSVMIRYRDRKTVTRSKKCSSPVESGQALFETARALFIRHWDNTPVRLLGITGSGLVERRAAAEQLSLFTYEEAAKKEPLYKAIEQLREKFGENIIQTGREAENPHDPPVL